MRRTQLDKIPVQTPAPKPFFSPSKEDAQSGQEAPFFSPARKAPQTMLQLQEDPVKTAAPVSVAPSPWDDFAVAFNREFQSSLHVFMQPGEPEFKTKGVVGEKSGNDVPAERLKALFTEEQREGLTDFIQTKKIPERIFNSGEQWRLTAQQRLLLSAHILAYGTVQPGNFEQRLHARMCFHWAQLTHHYAGTTSPGLSDGVMGNFDHSGNVVFGTGKSEQVFMGKKIPKEVLPLAEMEGDETSADEERQTGVGPIDASTDHGIAAANETAETKHKAHRRKELSFADLDKIKPGDWIWYYNANGSASGSHSVLFSRWAGEVQVTDGVRYRKAIAFSQGHPYQGGKEHVVNLGAKFHNGAITVSPVTYVSRTSEEARPAMTVEELLPGNKGKQKRKGKWIGNEEALSQDNRTYLERVAGPGFEIDELALTNKIRLENEGLIEALTPHLSEPQIQLLNQANSTDNLETLVRLTQKLRIVRKNMQLLVSNTEKTYEGTEADPAKKGSKRKKGLNETRAAAQEKFDTENKRLTAEIAAIDETLQPILQEINTRKGQIAELDKKEEIRDLLGKVRELNGLIRGTRDQAKRTAYKEQKQGILDKISELKALRKDIAVLRGEIRGLDTKSKRNMEWKRIKLEKEQKALYKLLPFGLAHPGNLANDIDNKWINGKIAALYKKEDIKAFAVPIPGYMPPPKPLRGKKKGAK